MNEISPCKNCTDRHTACHGTCDKYKQWLDQYHAQQKHAKEHGYILYIPDSAARERSTRRHIKASGAVKESGGRSMSNKKLGNQFETELCEVLAEHGFWTHNLAQNAAGQPADVIAVKEGQAYLIDCKVCSQGKFQYSRIEENQDLSMGLWNECGNGIGWFALKFDTGIYLVDREAIRVCSERHPAMTHELADMYGYSMEEWLWNNE